MNYSNDSGGQIQLQYGIQNLASELLSRERKDASKNSNQGSSFRGVKLRFQNFTLSKRKTLPGVL